MLGDGRRTHMGTNCKKNASWGKGKSIHSIIFNTASDLTYDLKFTVKFMSPISFLFTFISYSVATLLDIPFAAKHIQIGGLFPIVIDCYHLCSSASSKAATKWTGFFFFGRTKWTVWTCDLFTRTSCITFPSRRARHLICRPDLFQISSRASSPLRSAVLRTWFSWKNHPKKGEKEYGFR